MVDFFSNTIILVYFMYVWFQDQDLRYNVHIQPVFWFEGGGRDKIFIFPWIDDHLLA